MIVLNAQAKRERPAPPPIKLKKDLFSYLAEVCITDEEYDELRKELKFAKDEGCYVAFDARNLDEALVWADSPQGSDYWSDWHSKLEDRE